MPAVFLVPALVLAAGLAFALLFVHSGAWRRIRDRLDEIWYSLKDRLTTDAVISGVCWLGTVVLFVFFFKFRPSTEIDAEQRRLLMRAVVGVLVLGILGIVVGGCAGLRAGASTSRWYVAPAALGGSDTNSGRRVGKPLETLRAALEKAALTKGDGGPVEIVLAGKIEQALVVDVQVHVPVVLRGDPFLCPGILEGTITVGPGGDLRLGNDVTVTGGGRGVWVQGGRFTLDGGSIAGNQVDGAGAGVYVESGTFIMKDGVIEDNQTGGGSSVSGRAGGGVFVDGSKGGVFRKTGGVISGNQVPPSYKGSQVFVAQGRASKMRNAPAGDDITLDSGIEENWDDRDPHNR
jgi:hypothetical protein